MDVDSPREQKSHPSRQDVIVKRLALRGIPWKYLDHCQRGLVTFVKQNKTLLPEIVSCIIPSDADVSAVWRSNKSESSGGQRKAKLKILFGESLLWLQWLMFEGEPHASLSNLAQKSAGQRAVCGAVWGKNDLAYRCRTCEHDPTCAICVPCFQNGNHSDHDYSIMYTGGGCCDCGDLTAWRKEGFCSRHKGSEQIQPLPDNLIVSIGTVLDSLFSYWKDILLSMEFRRPPRESDRTYVHARAHALSLGIIEMLLEFCNCSESLLSSVSKRMPTCIGLLDVLLMGERFLDEEVVRKLHELLLKFLGEPLFKYEFAKVFIRYYQSNVKEVIKECSDKMLKEYQLLSTFSVQIFTVPTLALRLVKEANLLGILLSSLWDLFCSCVGEDNSLQASKWENLYDTTIRLVEDIRYVLSHEEVIQYIANERVDMLRIWLSALSLVQGMDAQTRVTDAHVELENENIQYPFVLGHCIGKVHALLVEGAFSVVETKENKDYAVFPLNIQGLEDDRLRHAKVGRLSHESSASKLSYTNVARPEISAECKKQSCGSVPSFGIWLIVECLEAIEAWFVPDIANRNAPSSMDASSSSGYNLLNLRKTLFKVKKGGNGNSSLRTHMLREGANGDRLSIPSENNERERFSPPFQVMTTERRQICQSSIHIVSGTSSQDACVSGGSDDNSMEIDSVEESETLGLLSLACWPEILYDVSSQEISFHIPLHRFLSSLLQTAIRNCYASMLDKEEHMPSFVSSTDHQEFFGKVLGTFQPYGFSSVVVEHPLRLRVFCAQVRAGMWRKNGDAAILISEWYRSARWAEPALESDIFLLQCCAALAPPELFVKRIQERYGLSSYTSLNLSEQTEYEPVLVQEMLTLIIQIVKERRFCGLSRSETLRRELIYKLAFGDATHSQLLKALPHDLAKSEELQKVMNMLAVYSKPSGTKQGKYSLKEEFWKELDLYHPRWNSRERQVAEERYFRFCNVSALNYQLPQWSKIFHPLNTISRIATSRAVCQIIQAVLYYALFAEVLPANRAPDSVLITALHLLALALDVCDKSKQASINSAGQEVHLSPMVDHSFSNASSRSKDSFPVFRYACEILDAGAQDANVSCKNQTMISLLVSLMRKYKEENCKSYTDTRQCNIFSLIENLLKMFARLSAECEAEISRLEPDLLNTISHQHLNAVMKNSASDSSFEERKAKMRERQAAIMEKMKAEQLKFAASLKATTIDDPDALASKQCSIPEGDHVLEEPKPVCSFCRDRYSQSPLCYLILLQRSRLMSLVANGPPAWIGDRKLAEADFSSKHVLSGLYGANSARTAHPMQTAGLEFTHDSEPAEMNVSLELLKSQLPATIGSQSQSLYDGGTETKSSLEMEYDIYQSIERIMQNRETDLDAVSGDHSYSSSHSTEAPKKWRNTESSVLGAYSASLSKEASKQHESSMYSLLRLSNIPSNSAVPTTAHTLSGQVDFDGIHISSCGHAVHQDCHERYLLSVKQRPIRRLGLEGGRIADPDLGELFCPVCRRLANSVLPIYSPANTISKQMVPSSSNPALLVVPSRSSDFGENVLQLPLALNLLQGAAKMVGQGRFLEFYSRKFNETIEPSLEAAVHKLCALHYPYSYGRLMASGRLCQSLMLWNTLTYSLMSMEIAARDKAHSHSTDSTLLESLFEEIHSSNGRILSLLLCTSQTSRCMNGLEVLLRFRAIELFSGSICFGVSGDINFSGAEKRKGIEDFDEAILTGAAYPIPENIDTGETFPDIQLWKQASDPILAYDPFSSLMLVLFSLPQPFVSSTEYFMALVHLFYVVSVIQALIMCYCNHYFDASCLDDWIPNDVCKTTAEAELAQKHFFNGIDTACQPKDMIRRLTLPYLRRCALLLKLVRSSKLASCDSSQTWKELSCHMNNDSVGDTSSLALELMGSNELEKMFQICSLELVLKDELVRTLTSKWSQHLNESNGSVYKCTPTVPFQLMRLPRLYQDLLERYVKLPCSHCNSVPDEPALCLLCGKLCASSWRYCCRENRCLEHAMACGAGIGVFLLVRRTTILLQRSVRQAFWPSPYLDVYGEEDVDMNRGNPLFLNEDRYQTLAHMVASHSLDHTSEVLRQTTINLLGAD